MQGTEEARGTIMGDYVKQRVGDVVGTLKERVGWNWGGVHAAEADLARGREIEYARVRPAEAGRDSWESLKEQ